MTGIGEESACTDVAFEDDTGFQQSFGYVLDFKEVVVVARPFDVSFDKGVREDSRAYLECHPEVGRKTFGLFEVVDLSFQFYVRESAFKRFSCWDYDQGFNNVFADDGAFWAYGGQEEVFDRFHFRRGEICNRALRDRLWIRAYAGGDVDTEVLEPFPFRRKRRKGGCLYQ